MSAPTPDRFEHTIAELAHVIGEDRGILWELARGVTVGEEGQAQSQNGAWRRESMGQAYRWYLATIGSTVGPTSTGLCADCLGTGFVGRRRCERCTPAMIGDPTGSHAAAQQWAKADQIANHLEAALKLALRALAEVRGAVNELGEGFAAVDARADRTPPISERHMPRTATKAEVKASRAAQGRRAERGEGQGAA